jgi:NAD(P)-dependent dehydrogenase (short-subunit alcohol dehydrogenase family)
MSADHGEEHAVSGHAEDAGAVVIVTAAGQGIGESIARRFAQGGSRVAVVDVNDAHARSVAADIEARGGAAVALAVDATDSSQVNAMVGDVIARWGRIDVLVNAAGGFNRLAPITDITDEEWMRVVNLNLTSAFFCARAVAPAMMARKQGRIVSIASGAGIAPNPYAASYLPYGAAKAGLIGFTKLLARDLGPYGITVNTVSPGTTATPRVKAVRDEASLKNIASQNPMRCLVEPEDTAAAVLFLASPEARYITGVNLNVNAGNLM